MNPDDKIRIAAFEWLKEKTSFIGDVLPWTLLADGFIFEGQRIHLAGQQGIWKPSMMSLPISITTKFNGPYPDKVTKDGLIEYRYRGEDINHRDNVGLRELMRLRKPLIYLYGLARGQYFVTFPAFIVNDDPSALKFTVQVDEVSSITESIVSDSEVVYGKDVALRRAYATTTAKIRLHQQSFRLRILAAYQNQCTLCRLRHPELLDAAHIIEDCDEMGDPVVTNGLSLCKIHHAAFDRNIIGINPDYDIHVRKDILQETDGPMLKYGLQSLDKQKIILPRNPLNYPDKERLDERYQRFLKAG